MNNYNFIIPVTGSIQISICAETVEEAVNSLTEKQAELEKIPNGHLDIDFTQMLIIENKINKLN